MADTERRTTDQIHNIFYPKSVAVIGTNKVKGTVPYDILHNILKDDFQGVVFPVSPREKSIDGVKAYKYVIDIEDEVDMAVLVFPSSVCHMAMEQCGKKGVKSVIIISAGFREVGGQGIEREKRIREIAREYGISFIGPNCLGVINTDPRCNFNASFARQMPEAGNIAFLSQSGALCTAVLDYARARHIGFSKFVSFGNKADVTEIDLLYYLKDDPKTRVILLYLEEVTDGRALMEVCRQIIEQSGKPVLILKSGRTNEGASAAASHTGSLAGSDEVCDAAFKQAGIIRAFTIEDMFNYALALVYQPLPESGRVAIITNAGGPGVLATDRVISENLSLAKFSDNTTESLKKSLPQTANIKNPVDVIGDARADRYDAALSAVLKDDQVAGALVILTPQSMTDIKSIADEICKINGLYNKPVYASFMGEADVHIGVDILQRRSIPHYQLPEDMCSAFARAWQFKQVLTQKHIEPKIFTDADKDAAHAILNKAHAQGRKYLPEAEAVEILRLYRLPILPSGLVSSEEEAVKMAEKIGFPVVMKLISDSVVHKFDIGGVVLNISDSQSAADAYKSILNSAGKAGVEINGVFVQKMVEHGEGIILGIKKDNSFGPVVMFGLGGLFVEILKDVSLKVAPIDPESVSEMVREIKFYPVLAGARGKKEKDVKCLEICIQRLAQLAVECPQICELDINPLIIQDKGKGCFVADTKIMIDIKRKN